MSGYPSKTKLATVLRELGYEKAAKSADRCEAFDKEVFCFPCFTSFAERREAEAKLEARGFKVDRRYDERGTCAEVAVNYFKAWHWNE